ncbi:MAG: cytochrome c oxidase subunit II [Acidiferrobacteraceae bacterium]
MSRSRPATGIGSRLIAGISFLLFSGIASADYALNFQTPVTPIAESVLKLHNMIMTICFVIFVLVFGVMFYSIAVHRKSRGHKASKFDDNPKLEVLWTIIPFLILIGLAIPSTATLIKMDDTSNSDLTVKITGHQWKWEYEYPEQGIDFISALSTPRDQIENKAKKDKNYLLEVDNPLVIPVNKKVRFVITSGDVIHSWWVPALGQKKDAIPGYINEIWTRVEKPGTYRGQCAELCGKDHGFMPIVVKAVSEDEFNKWANQQKGKMVAQAAAVGKTWTKADLMKNGEKVYQKNCAACHQANGLGVPGVFPPIATGHPFSASDAMVKDLTERGFYKDGKIAEGTVDQHIDIVVNGIPGTAMAAFGKQLGAADIASVITFERNSFGNSTGDVIQPSQVKAHQR